MMDFTEIFDLLLECPDGSEITIDAHGAVVVLDGRARMKHMEKLMDMFIYLVVLIVLVSSLVGGLIGAWIAIVFVSRRHKDDIAHIDEGLKGCRYGTQFDPTFKQPIEIYEHSILSPEARKEAQKAMPPGEGIRL